MVVADKFALEAENISVIVEEEVVVIVAEPAKSNLKERIGVVDVHFFEVAILYFAAISTLRTVSWTTSTIRARNSILSEKPTTVFFSTAFSFLRFL